MTDTSNIFLTRMLALQPWTRFVQKSVTILPQRMEIKHCYSHLSQMQILLHPSLRQLQLMLHRNGRTSLGRATTRANFKLFRLSFMLIYHSRLRCFLMKFDSRIKRHHVMYSHIQLWIAKLRGSTSRTSHASRNAKGLHIR